MLVADASALVSLGSVDLLETVLAEYDLHTTETVVSELADTAEYDDAHARGAERALAARERMSVHDVADPVSTSRVDPGEGSCAVLADRLGAEFLLTDDLRALPELAASTDARVAISPIVLRALVERGVLDRATARDHLEELADRRGWLGAPIYRRARALFEDE